MDSTIKSLAASREPLGYLSVIKNAGWLLVLTVVTGLLSIHLGQDANWDLQNYHIYNAFAFFHRRHELDVGATAQWYFNPAPDLFYYALIHFFLHHAKFVAFVQGGQAGILWWLLWLLGEQARSHLGISAWIARLAWIAACSGSVLISEIGTTFNDIPQTYLTIAGLFFLVQYSMDDSRRIHLCFSFFLFGAATGFKLTSAVFMIAAVAALPFVNRSARGLALAVLFGTLGLLVSGGWWFIHLSADYQNPLFPYFNNIFHSSWWSSSAMTETRFFPRSALQWIAYPAYWAVPNRDLVTEVKFADGRVLIGLLGAAGCLVRLFAGTTPAHLRMRRYVYPVAIFFMVSYVLWLRTFSIYRYAMPLETLSPFMLMMFFSTFKTKPSKPSAKRLLDILFLAILAGTVISTQYPDWMRAPYSRAVLDLQTSLDAKGATIVAAAGDPPVSYVFALMPDAAHFITIAGSDVMGTRLFERASSIIASSTKIYVLYQEARNPQVVTDVQHYWGLVRSTEPCLPVKTNIGGDFMACRLQHAPTDH